MIICGGPPMLTDIKRHLLDHAFVEGSHGEPGQLVVEKAFVDA